MKTGHAIAEDEISDLSDFEADIAHVASNYLNEGKGKKVICCLRRIKGQKSCMLYPEDPFKGYWDIYIALVLIFTSLVTPYRIALVEVDNFEWNIINNTVDIMFLIDIIIIFNSAYEDEDFNLIDVRK